MFRVGIIGSGGMARHHADAFDKLEHVTLVAIASRNRNTGSALASAHGAEYVADWRALLERPDIDGVVITTHNDSHGEIAIAALALGRHVLMEYPLARRIEEGERAVALAEERELVLRLTHSETLSGTHAALRKKVAALGDLLLAAFDRLTPGRGARPEVLFNLPVSGPPVHFFIYHVYPVVDLFGPAAWVEASAVYTGLTPEGRYDSFVNVVTVGFARGGVGQWRWCGGIEIEKAEQQTRYVLAGGTILDGEQGWLLSTREGTERIQPSEDVHLSHQERWLDEIRRGEFAAARRDARTALDAIRLSLGAERAMNEGRRILFTSKDH